MLHAILPFHDISFTLLSCFTCWIFDFLSFLAAISFIYIIDWYFHFHYRYITNYYCYLLPYICRFQALPCRFHISIRFLLFMRCHCPHFADDAWLPFCRCFASSLLYIILLIIDAIMPLLFIYYMTLLLYLLHYHYAILLTFHCIALSFSLILLSFISLIILFSFITLRYISLLYFLFYALLAFIFFLRFAARLILFSLFSLSLLITPLIFWIRLFIVISLSFSLFLQHYFIYLFAISFSFLLFITFYCFHNISSFTASLSLFFNIDYLLFRLLLLALFISVH